jgi:predicted nucleic-acid-binding protein
VIGLDTNVLVRYLTQDQPAQAARAEAAILRATAGGGRCAISPVVLCELVWVLTGAYKTPKADVLAALDGILTTEAFEIIDRPVIAEAVEAYRLGRADFSDFVIGLTDLAAGCTETVTFDRALHGVRGFRNL